MNTKTENQTATPAELDDLFEQAARNQGFTNLQEMAEVANWCAGEVSPESISEFMDDPASAPMVPKPEFKAQYEAWLQGRRQRK